jgi:hypothetical protein
VAERAVRLAEAVAALAAAADLGLGLPLDHGLRTGLIAMRLADLVGLAVHDREDLFYLTLLRMAGCTVESSSFAYHFGDEVRFGADTQALDYGNYPGSSSSHRRSASPRACPAAPGRPGRSPRPGPSARLRLTPQSVTEYHQTVAMRLANRPRVRLGFYTDNRMLAILRRDVDPRVGSPIDDPELVAPLVPAPAT